MEVFQYFSDKLLVKCPACGKNRLERQIGTGSAVIFKGSGFYETDYKRKSETGKSCGGKSGESSGEGGKKEKKPSGSEKSPE